MYEYELIKKEGIVFNNSEPTQQPWLTINIGNIFFNQGQYTKALERYKLSKTYFSQLDSLLPKIRGLSTTYNNIALVHIELKNYNLALENISKAYNLRIKNNFNPIDIAHSYKSFSELYFIWNMHVCMYVCMFIHTPYSVSHITYDIVTYVFLYDILYHTILYIGLTTVSITPVSNN